MSEGARSKQASLIDWTKGELEEDIPKGLRRWLRDTGQLPAGTI